MLSQNTTMKILQILLFASVEYSKFLPHVYPCGPFLVHLDFSYCGSSVDLLLVLLIVDLQN